MQCIEKLAHINKQDPHELRKMLSLSCMACSAVVLNHQIQQTEELNKCTRAVLVLAIKSRLLELGYFIEL